jgi:hypothetical protein
MEKRRSVAREGRKWVVYFRSIFMDFLSLLFCGHVSQNMDTNYFVLNNFSRYDVGIFKSNFPFFKFD